MPTHVHESKVGIVRNDNRPFRRTNDGRLRGTVYSDEIPVVVKEQLAHKCLSPDEYERRMKLYTKRTGKRLPLFDQSTKPEPIQSLPICAGCGTVAPQCSHIGKFGWESLRTGNIYYNERVSMVFCKECVGLAKQYEAQSNKQES